MLTNLVKYTLYVCVAGWIGTHFLLQRLPPLSDISPELYNDPVQTLIQPTPPFQINYRNHITTVVPMAEYQLSGMVVSHNDPFVWYTFDISHDENSLDTRDFCVIWGGNIKNSDYGDVHVHNDDSFCVVKWRGGVRGFNGEYLSNNHLITANEDIRRRIAEVQVGDQIIIKGKLVNYSEDRWNGRFRNSSLTRSDTGNGACEVLLVEELRIISSHNYLWAKLHQFFLYGLAAVLIAGIALLFSPSKPTYPLHAVINKLRLKRRY
jgi:hypothetical protein